MVANVRAIDVQVLADDVVAKAQYFQMRRQLFSCVMTHPCLCPKAAKQLRTRLYHLERDFRMGSYKREHMLPRMQRILRCGQANIRKNVAIFIAYNFS